MFDNPAGLWCLQQMVPKRRERKKDVDESQLSPDGRLTLFVCAYEEAFSILIFSLILSLFYANQFFFSWQFFCCGASLLCSKIKYEYFYMHSHAHLTVPAGNAGS